MSSKSAWHASSGRTAQLCAAIRSANAVPTVERRLASAGHDCTLFEAGVRLSSRHPEVFEAVLKRHHKGAPGAKIALIAAQGDIPEQPRAGYPAKSFLGPFSENWNPLTCVRLAAESGCSRNTCPADRTVSAEQFNARQWLNNATRLSGIEWLWSAKRA